MIEAGTSSDAVTDAGRCLSAVYHVSTYPRRRMEGRMVHHHWTGVRPESRWSFDCHTTTPKRMTEPRIIRLPATSKLETFANVFFAMTFSTAQKIVAAKI